MTNDVLISFDPHHTRYRCCCKSVHIKVWFLLPEVETSASNLKGAYAVAFFYALIIVCNLGIRSYKSNEVEWNWQLLFLVSDSVAVVCLFYGIARENPAFLQPFTVVSIVTISFCILLTILYSSAIYDPNSYAGEQIEILLADKVQYFAESLSMKHRSGENIINMRLLYSIVLFYKTCWKMLDFIQLNNGNFTVIISTAALGSLVYAGTVVVHSWFMIIVVRCAQYFRNIHLVNSTHSNEVAPYNTNSDRLDHSVQREEVNVV
uniref:Lysosomal cystine transporter n=1 Tax=Heterorhabditis bacteriophora TaxID=37862 RepID=A0A1I7XGS0_HETBA